MLLFQISIKFFKFSRYIGPASTPKAACIFCLFFLLLPLTPSIAEYRESGQDLAQRHMCAACHGINGISKNPNIPNLAGQKFKYLKKQTDMFKSRKAREFEGELISSRSHPIMGELSQSLSKNELNRIIHYYSKLACNVKTSRKITTIIPEAKRCETCHGGLRSSPFRDSPNLAGQKQQYMLHQLRKMTQPSLTDKDEDSRSHRLSELMVQDLTDKDLIKITRYYEDMGC